MDSESIAIVSIVFGTPVAILTIVFTYKLLKHWIDRKTPEPSSIQAKGQNHATSAELTAKAENLQRRLNNLEEILKTENQPGGET